MTTYRKALPRPTPETQEFWEGLRQHRFTLQRCTVCQPAYFYPRPFCPQLDCHSRAFAMADVQHSDIDVVNLYDAFTFTPLLALEDLGFCQPGESGAFVSKQRTAPGGDFLMNTNGGGLSYTHTGMYGMFCILEVIRQVRGDFVGTPRQVPDVTIGLAHGPGGFFSAAGTAILAR